MRRPLGLLAALGAGYAFLYLPILLLIVFSFNESRLVSVWTGFSTRWYGELLRNARVLDAAWLSLAVAAVSATIAVVIGGLSGFVLARYGRFSFRWLFAALLAVPLVMPEVVTGLSLLLTFVSIDRVVGLERGFGTLVVAHATLSLAFVAVIVQARMSGLDPAMEEAAYDLGARPAKVFFTVTVPMLAPALAAGWLLAFTLSLDDLVVASFVTGPGATTLPMVIFSSVRLGLSPQVNALAAILVIVVTCLAVLAAWVNRQRSAFDPS
ncbi:MAG TPA: ABC transporter permease subunit [Alphaproteobacteria bacterium]|nr:ABC transporter permease subunit [Alphaproteobacteria bacterium]